MGYRLLTLDNLTSGVRGANNSYVLCFSTESSVIDDIIRELLPDVCYTISGLEISFQ